MAHNGEVVNEGDDTDGELHDEGWETQGVDFSDPAQGHRRAGEVQIAPLGEKMGQQDQHAEDGANGGGQSCAADAHM